MRNNRIIFIFSIVFALLFFCCACKDKNALTKYDYGNTIKRYVVFSEKTENIKPDARFEDYVDKKIIEEIKESGLLTECYDGTVKKGDKVRFTITSDQYGEIETDEAFAGDESYKYKSVMSDIIGKRVGTSFDTIVNNIDSSSVNLHITIDCVLLPKLNDSTANAMGYKNAEDYISDFNKTSFKDYVLNNLKNSVTIKKYPKKEYEEYCKEYTEYMSQYAAGYGLTVDEYKDKNKITKSDFEKMSDEYARNKISDEIYLYAFAQKNGIIITQEQIENKIKDLAGDGEKTEDVIKQTGRGTIEKMCLEDSVFLFIDK